MRRFHKNGLIATAILVLAGCDHTRTRIVGPHDSIAPDEPRSVTTVTGDGFVTIRWTAPADRDVDGYAIYISVDDREYWFVAEVSASHRHWVVDGSSIPRSVPVEFVNGNTYWFGVTAIDRSGNESSLSTGSTTFDTPRPSGQGLRLYDVNGPRAQESGYDFSRSPYGYAMHGADLFADVYFVRDAGQAWIRTAHPGVVEMQDMGAVHFDDPTVGWFDPAGWHGASSVRLVPGHVILVLIWEETRPDNQREPYNVGKFQVTQLAADSVTLQWAYQIAPNNPELKPASSVSSPGMAPHAAPPVRSLRGREVQR